MIKKEKESTKNIKDIKSKQESKQYLYKREEEDAEERSKKLLKIKKKRITTKGNV